MHNYILAGLIVTLVLFSESIATAITNLIV